MAHSLQARDQVGEAATGEAERDYLAALSSVLKELPFSLILSDCKENLFFWRRLSSVSRSSQPSFFVPV